MIGLDTASISEFAIVVAGFAGLIVAVAQRGGRVHPLDKYRMVTMLLYAFTAAFGALLPTIMRSFGIEGDEVWRQSGLYLALLITANLLGTQLYQRILTDDQRGRLRWWMFALVVVGNGALVLWLFGNLTGLAPGPASAPYFCGLVWQLVLASILFVRLILVERPEPHEG